MIAVIAVVAVITFLWFNPPKILLAQIPPATSAPAALLIKVDPTADTIGVTYGDIFLGKVSLLSAFDSSPIAGETLLVVISSPNGGTFKPYFASTDSAGLALTDSAGNLLIRVPTYSVGSQLQGDADTLPQLITVTVTLQQDSSQNATWTLEPVIPSGLNQMILKEAISEFDALAQSLRGLTDTDVRQLPDPTLGAGFEQYMLDKFTDLMEAFADNREDPKQYSLIYGRMVDIFTDSSLPDSLRALTADALAGGSPKEFEALDKTEYDRFVGDSIVRILSPMREEPQSRNILAEIFYFWTRDSAARRIVKENYINGYPVHTIGIVINQKLDPDHIDILEAALDSPDTYRRFEAAKSLAEGGSKNQRIIDVMSQDMQSAAEISARREPDRPGASPDDRISFIIGVLGRVGTTEAAEAIANVFGYDVKSKPFVQGRAFNALKALGRLDLVPASWNLLGDADPRHLRPPPDPRTMGPRYKPSR